MLTPYQLVHSLLVKIDGFSRTVREQWVHDAGVEFLKGYIAPDLSADRFAYELLDTAYHQGGDTPLRDIVRHLRLTIEGQSGEREALDEILAQENLAVTLFPQGRVPWATMEALALAAALAHFETLPTDHIPLIHSLPTPHKMELPSNRDFVGREEELKAIAKAVKTGQVAAVVAAGIGGVGKTQLAVEWVHRYGHYFRGGVFWLDFSRPADLLLEIAAAGTKYNLTGYAGLDIEAKVEQIKTKWAEPTPTLLIFDNCEDPALAQDYLPVTGGARVLMTSRDQTWNESLRARGVHQIAIETLPRAKSIELLRKFRPNMTEEDANGIAQEVGDLPLALHIAGSYLKQMKGTTFGDPAIYLASLRDPDLLQRLDEQIEWLYGDLPTNHEWSVAKTFAVSMDRITTIKRVDHQLLRDLLLLMAHFAPGVSIPVAWLYQNVPEGKSEAHAKRAFTHLLKLGLVEEPEEGNTLRMHRLVAQVVLASTTTEAATAAESQSETIILEVEPTYGQADFVAQMDRWLPHAREVAERALVRRDEQAALLANAIGFQLNYLALYDQAIEWVQKELEIRREVLGARHPATATSLNNLAVLYRVQGKYEQAVPLHEEALDICHQMVGNRHPNTAQSLNNLAELYRVQEKYEAALPLYEEALGIYREVLGARHPDTATSLNNLALLYQSHGKYEAALPLYEEALGIWREVLGARHPQAAGSLNNLAALYRAQGQYEVALSLYEEALGIRREVLGARHPSTAGSLNNLAKLYELQGKYEQALPLYEEALGIWREVLGARHPDTAQSLNNLAVLYESQGKYEVALPLFEEAVSILAERLGINHPTTKIIMETRDVVRSIVEQQGKA